MREGRGEGRQKGAIYEVKPRAPEGAKTSNLGALWFALT